MTVAVLIATKAGQVNKSNAVYLTAHDAATGTVLNDDSPTTGQASTFSVNRGAVVFDLSSYSGIAITAATLSLYGYGAVDFSDTDFDLTIVSGTDLADTLVDTDYGELLNDTTSFGSMSTSGWTLGAYNIVTINATGIAAITAALGGKIRFGLRSSRDISVTTPSGNEYVIISGQIDAGQEPKLTITYTTVYPSEPLARVANLIHRYDARQAINQLEISLGDITSVLTPPFMESPARATADKQKAQDSTPIVDTAVDEATSKAVVALKNYWSRQIPLYSANVTALQPEPKSLTAKQLGMTQEELAKLANQPGIIELLRQLGKR